MVRVPATAVAFWYQISSDLIGHIQMSTHRRYKSHTLLNRDECCEIVVASIWTITKMFWPLFFRFIFISKWVRFGITFLVCDCAAPSIFRENTNKQTNKSDFKWCQRPETVECIRFYCSNSRIPATLVAHFLNVHLVSVYWEETSSVHV